MSESSFLVWEEPPAAHTSRGLVPHELIAATLRRNPARWARILDAGTSTGLATWINKGGKAAYRPAGSFEAVYRQGAIYARFVGGGAALNRDKENQQ